MAGCRYFPLAYFGDPTPTVASGDNPHWEVLEAVAAQLSALPGIDGLPTPKVRELPYVLADVNTRPLCFVCPPDGQGERVIKHVFKGASGSGGITWWGYPVVVLLIFDGQRKLGSGLEARLQLRHDVGERLFATDLSGSNKVFDCDPSPRAVADVQAALGSSLIVSGFQFTYTYPRTRTTTGG